MFSVRRLQLGEGDLFKKIRLTSLRESPFAFSSTYESALKRTPESWNEQADQSAEGLDRATFLVFSEAAPIGMAALYRDLNTVDTGEVVQVWVAPECRGTGAAKALMEALLGWAKENGFRKVLVGINPGNERALHFYQRLGFRPVHEMKEDCAGSLLVKNVG